ncbi:MAG: hypothetical protein IT379_33265 [Deltaproteobacteria bacterium]|nr:hypothetical protein [Deltaproteobacteria bacterium]
MKSLRLLVGSVLVLSAGLAATCGTSSGDADAAAGGVLVGLLELPMSHRSAPAFTTSNAARVEIGPREVRLDGRTIGQLAEGRFPDNAIAEGKVAALQQALSSNSRRRAALYIHAMVPYQTTHQVISTLLGAGITELGVAIRKVGSNAEGWITFSGVKVVPGDLEEVPFDLVSPVMWDDFVNVWDDVASACESGGEADCTHKPRFHATGGRLQIVTLARGDGLSIRLTRVGAPPPEQVHLEEDQELMGAGPEKQRPIKLQRRGPGARRFNEMQRDAGGIDPTTGAMFTMRAQQTTAGPSPVSAVLRPLCGNRACGVIVEGDPATPSGRVFSLLGAAFPDGAGVPNVAFRTPR